jgi:hypothetical protein
LATVSVLNQPAIGVLVPDYYRLRPLGCQVAAHVFSPMTGTNRALVALIWHVMRQRANRTG